MSSEILKNCWSKDTDKSTTTFLEDFEILEYINFH